MAYILKYTSNFYNFYNKYIEVEISKTDYSGTVTALRNTEVYVEVNFQDNNTPVIGTGCSIVVINQGEFTDLDDLLTTTEKQFKCVIKYAGTIVFQGFSICDLNEQQFNKLARIKLQFTDYLRRLEGHFAENFFVGSNTDLLTLVQELYVTVGFGAAYELYVNSTLFEDSMNQADTDTFLKQTYVENNMFFSDPNTYDDVYAAVNKTLKSFGAFLYSAGDKWIIERQEDIMRGGGPMVPWVKYTLYQVGSSVSGLMEAYNKQDGDFQYADESQILEYASGLKTLILNLKDKQYDTFVFNDYLLTMNTVSDFTPEPGTLAFKTWYRYTDVIIMQVGNDYRGIGSFVKWSYPLTDDAAGEFASMGLYYAFQVQIPVTPEEPISMNVDYKASLEFDLTPIASLEIPFAIRVDGGTKDGYYLGYINGPAGTPILTWSTTYYAFKTIVDTSIEGNKTMVFSVSESFNMTDTVAVDPGHGMPVQTIVGLWEQLGSPVTQKFMIYFYPIELHFKDNPTPGALFFNRVNYIGDIEVTLTQQKTRNKITYNINADFVKTEEQDMEFWDLTNINFSNGLMYGLGGIGNDAIAKTALWTSELCPIPQELMDIYAKSKFRNYSRTIHKLKARILHDGYMKPFSVLTDDNRANTYFLLQSYTWDLFNGSYDIVAEEYTTEDVLLSEEGDSGGASSGGGGGDPGIIPLAPTGLNAVQGSPGQFIVVSWNDAIGATGYIVQRKPYYNGIAWIDNWKTIDEGPPGSIFNAASDLVQLEAAIMDGTVISYRIASKTTQLYGAFSGTVTVIWAN